MPGGPVVRRHDRWTGLAAAAAAAAAGAAAAAAAGTRTRSRTHTRTPTRTPTRTRTPTAPHPHPKVGDLTPDMGVKSPLFDDLPCLLRRRALDPRRLPELRPRSPWRSRGRSPSPSRPVGPTPPGRRPGLAPSAVLQARGRPHHERWTRHTHHYAGTGQVLPSDVASQYRTRRNRTWADRTVE